MKQKFIKPVFVDIIPDHIEEGVFYICERYTTAIHKCCCGCGEEVVTPLSAADWSVRKTGNAVSLMPSIGNWGFACKSHYYIQQNHVRWATRFSQWQIDQVRVRDKTDKRAFIKASNRQKGKTWKLSAQIFKFLKQAIRWLKK